MSFPRFFKAIALSAAFILPHASALAKSNVYVTEFDGATSSDNVAMIRNAVMDGLVKTNRVNLYAPDSDEARYFENLRRNRDNVSAQDLETLRQLETHGSQVLVLGHIDALNVTWKTDDKGKTTYKAKLTLTLKAVNALDGQMLATQTYELGDAFLFGGASGDTERDAVQKLPGLVRGRMAGFVEYVFPVAGRILELENIKGDKVNQLYIDLGTSEGITPGTHFEVKLIRIIGGKKSYTTIGKLEAKEVQGDEITLCNVKGGKQEILKAYRAGQEIVVVSCQ